MTFRSAIILALLTGSTSVWGATAQEEFNAGSNAYNQGNYGAAVDACKRATDANPKFWQAYQAMGNAFYKMGNIGDARAAYQKSLEINPNNPGLKQFVDQMPASNSGGSVGGEESPLPLGGSFIWSLEISGGAAPVSDLSDAYGMPVTGLSPVVMSIAGKVDHALFPDLHAGLGLEYLSRGSETITFPTWPSGAEEVWHISALGSDLSLKLLMPIFPKINAVVRGSVGVYFLVGSNVTATVSGVSTKYDLDSFGVGETGELQLELLQGRGFAIDGGVGYRSLVFKPYTAGSSAKVVNPDGSDARLDLSGIFVSCALKLY